MNSDDILLIAKRREELAIRRSTLVPLLKYKSELDACSSFHELLRILSDRAEHVNKYIAKGIERDEKELDEFEDICRKEIMTLTLEIKP